MQDSRSSKTVFLISTAIVLVSLLVPLNPEYAFPLLPEGIILVLCSSLFLFLKTSRNTRLSVSSAVLLVAIIFHHFAILTPRMLLALKDFGGKCKTAGSVIYQLECSFQSSGMLSWNIRLYSYLTSALLVFLTFFFAASLIPTAKRKLLYIPLIALFFVYFADAYARIMGLDSSLPPWIGLPENLDERDRMATWFTNYGWVWPYLAPAAAVSLWMALGKHRFRIRASGSILLILIVISLLLNQQRGYFLLCLGLAILGLIFEARKRLRGRVTKQTRVAALLLPGALGTALVYVFVNFSDLKDLLAQFGIKIQKLPFSSSPERISIWKDALASLAERPFYGFGHASWHKESVIRNFSYKFDTAHNWIIQTIFELGLIHFAFISSILIFIAYKAFKASKELASGRLLFAASFGSLIIVTLVQEIDYLRPTFYLYAVFFGTLAAFPAESSKYEFKKFLTVFFTGTFLVGFLSLAISALAFSRGSYAFEGDERTEDPLERWLSPVASLVVTRGQGSSTYSVFPIRFNPQVQSYRLPFLTPTNFTPASTEKWSLVSFPNPGNGIERYEIHSDGSLRIQSRQLSSRIMYPPRQSKLGLLNTNNIEIDTGTTSDLVLYCTENCSFIGQSCQDPSQIKIRLSNESSEKVSFNITVRPFRGTQAHQQILEVSPKDSAVFQQSAPANGTGWFDISIQSSGRFRLSAGECG